MLIHFLARIPKIIRGIKSMSQLPKDSFDENSAELYFEDRSDDELEDWYKRIQWMNLVYWLHDEKFKNKSEWFWSNLKIKSKKSTKRKSIKKVK